jgi:hypothetical protein
MEEVRLYWEVEFERQGYTYTPTETIPRERLLVSHRGLLRYGEGRDARSHRT